MLISFWLISQTSSQNPLLCHVWSQRRRWDTPSYAVANGVYSLRNLSWFPALLSVRGHVSVASQVCSYLTNCWGKCQLALLCKHFVIVLLWLSRCILMCLLLGFRLRTQRFVQRVRNDNVNWPAGLEDLKLQQVSWKWRAWSRCDLLYVLEPPGKCRKLQLALGTAF